jgi:retinol dehydrogenase-14
MSRMEELKPSQEDLRGKTILLTGGNSGIGKAAALGLAKLGATLVLVCRDESKAQTAKDEIVRESGNGSVELITADLLLQSEVRKAAAEFLSTHSHLDVLINNAGTNYPNYDETEDGIERTMAVNYFAPFLLTNLLLDSMGKTRPSRIVNVASVAHHNGQLDLDNLTRDKRMGLFGLAAYGRSKLALVLFTYELARRLRGKRVTANCLHPGAVRTNIWAHSGAASPIARFGSLFMRSAREGAKSSIYLASSPEVNGVSGEYFNDSKPTRSSRDSYDKSVAGRLWDLSLQTTHLLEQRSLAC